MGPPREEKIGKKISGGARIYSGDTHIAWIWDAATKWPRTARCGVRSKVVSAQVVYSNLRNETKASKVMLGGTHQVFSSSTTFSVGITPLFDIGVFTTGLIQVPALLPLLVMWPSRQTAMTTS